MSLTLAFAMLSGALIAGDPDMAWSTDSQPASAPVEVPPAPAPPPVAASEPLEAQPAMAKVAPARSALEKNFRILFELGFSASPSSMGQLGGAVEIDWYPLRYVRLAASIGGAWIPRSSYGSVESHSAVKVLGGVDAVLPFTWGELFVGVESGAAYSDAPRSSATFPNCFDCGSSESWWDTSPMALLRGGLEVTLARPLIIGFELGYSLFAHRFGELHWAEAHGRIGFAF